MQFTLFNKNLILTFPACEVYLYKFQLESGKYMTDWHNSEQDTQGTVDEKLTKYTTLEQTKSEIDLAKNSIILSVSSIYATKSELGEIEGRVSDVELKITDEAIISTVRESTQYTDDLNALGSRISDAELKLTKDALTTTIGNYYATQTYVNESVDAIEIGGKNILRNSRTLPTDGNKGEMYEISASSAFTATIYQDSSFPGISGKMSYLRMQKSEATSSSAMCVINQYVKLIAEKTYTLSAYMYALASVDHSGKIRPTLRIDNGTGNILYINLSAVERFGVYQKISYTFVVTSDCLDTDGYCRVRYGAVYDADAYGAVKIGGLMLEEGTKASAWSPAPEDVTTSIEAVETIATQTATKFDWLVKSGTSASDFTLTDRTATLIAETISLNGNVKVNGDMLVDGAVTTNKIAAGAITADSTIIADGAIDTAKIKDAAITNAKIGSVDASKITTGQLSADRIDVSGLFAKDITATGTISGIKLSGATGSFEGDVAATSFSLNGATISTEYKTIETWNIVLGDDDVYIKPAGAIGVNSVLTFGSDYGLYTESDIYANTLKIRYLVYTPELQSDNINALSLGANNVKIMQDLTCNGTATFSGDATFSGTTLIKDYNGSNRRPVGSLGTAANRTAYIGTYVDSSGTYYITANGRYGGDTYVTKKINTTSSDIRLKENISKTVIEALPILNQIEMCQFDWKQTHVHQKIGFVADYLEQIDPSMAIGGGYDSDGNMDEKSVNEFYLMGYVVKGIQELSKDVSEIKTVNNNLQSQVQSLQYQLQQAFVEIAEQDKLIKQLQVML